MLDGKTLIEKSRKRETKCLYKTEASYSFKPGFLVERLHWCPVYPTLIYDKYFLDADGEWKGWENFRYQTKEELRKSSRHGYGDRFERLYLFGYYSRYLWGWVFKSKRLLEDPSLSGLRGNINNQVDLVSGQFMGIDGSGVGRDCGLLEDLRRNKSLTQTEKCELLVFLFVSEISFAVYYQKEAISAGSGDDLYDKDYEFGYVEDWYWDDTKMGIPRLYSFLTYYEFEQRFFDKRFEYNLYPQVVLDKYITNRAEWAVFLLFLRFWVCALEDNYRSLVFGDKKDWYKDKIRDYKAKLAHYEANSDVIDKARLKARLEAEFTDRRAFPKFLPEGVYRQHDESLNYQLLLIVLRTYEEVYEDKRVSSFKGSRILAGFLEKKLSMKFLFWIRTRKWLISYDDNLMHLFFGYYHRYFDRYLPKFLQKVLGHLLYRAYGYFHDRFKKLVEDSGYPWYQKSNERIRESF